MIEGHLDHYTETRLLWQSRYLTLWSDGALHFHKTNGDMKTKELWSIPLLSYEFSVSISKAQSDREERKILEIDILCPVWHKSKCPNPISLSSRCDSDLLTWFRVLSRISRTTKSSFQRGSEFCQQIQHRAPSDYSCDRIASASMEANRNTRFCMCIDLFLNRLCLMEI
jgi:hypothetical protein